MDTLAQTALAQMGALGWEVSDVAAPFSAASWITLRSFAVGTGMSALYDDPAKRAKLKPAAIYEIERGKALSALDIAQCKYGRFGLVSTRNHFV